MIEMNASMAAARRSSRGFTILEVLVASLVLFSAIAIGSIVLKTAMGQVNRISHHTRVASAMYAVKELVREELEQETLQGKGNWGEGIEYEWKAVPLKAAMNVVNFDYMDEIPEPGKFKLTLYSLRLSIREKNASFKPRAFRYKELVYQKANTG